MKFEGFLHLNIRCSKEDLPAIEKFYGELLGLKTGYRPDFKFGGIWLYDLPGLVLPAFTLAIPLAGFLSQATRTEFERSLQQPFVLTARLRGMGDTAVRLRHVLRHAILPAVTLTGWALGATLSGAVVVESIFSRPGIGSVLVTAVNAHDLPVVVGIVTLVAAFYVIANLLVDIGYTIVDPRLVFA